MLTIVLYLFSMLTLDHEIN